MTRKVVFLCFPTDLDAELKYLEEEKNCLYDLFSVKDHLHTFCRPTSTLDSIVSDLEKYRDRIILFHFAGHANRESLLLKDGKAFTEGIVSKLEKCPNLRLIFLNGCSTLDQEKLFSQLPSKPVVVATNNLIGDKTAVAFAKSFYEHFCRKGQTVKGAYNEAVGTAKVQKSKVRDIDMEKQFSSEEVSDYLYSLNGEEYKNYDYKLPVAQAPQPNYSPNKMLRVKLLKAMAVQNEKVRKEYDEAITNSWNEGDKQEIILKNIPITISEQVRKLFSRPIGEGDQTKFYHKVSANRLKQYVVIYKTLVEFLAFTLFADLCFKLVKDGNLLFRGNEYPDLKKIFFLRSEEKKHSFFPDLIEKIRSVFNSLQLPYFLEGVEQLPNFTDPTNRFGLAIEYLEDLANKRIEILEEGEVHQHCVEGEKRLLHLLEETAFLSNFTILSVRQIRVLKAPHEQKALFEHMYYRMIPNANREYSEISESRMTYLENLCVFLEVNRETDEPYLNLSPFLIDVNAIILDLGRTPKEYKPKLHSLIWFTETEPNIEYKHIYTPNEKCRICPQELEDIETYPYEDEYEDEIRTRTPFQFVRDQLNAYWERLFGDVPQT